MDGLFAGIGLAITASIFLNVGKGVQKWKVKTLAHGRKVLTREHRRDFVIWLAGILMTTSATIFYSAALKFTDKSSMVSAFNGVGMIGLVLFAWLVLKEKIGRQELGGAALILIGTAMMGIFDQPVGDQQVGLEGIGIGGGILAAVFIPMATYAWVRRRWHGFTFGALAGAMIGTSMVLGDLALVEAGGGLIDQLKNPYPYLALIIGTGALGVTQLAFWRAKAMVVVPTTNSFVILTPVFIEFFASGTILHPAQYAGIGAIVIGVVLLTTADHSAPPGQVAENAPSAPPEGEPTASPEANPT